MKKTNYYVLSLLMAAGLAACSAEIDSTQQQGDQVPLQLTATKLVDNAEVQESHARRAANNLYTSSFDGGESVKVWLNDTDNSDDYTINSTDQATLEGGSLYYPAGSTGTATVFALYPSTSTSSHTVAYNQSGDDAYKQSDLMYATKTVDLSEKTSSQALQFSHQLVKLHVHIVKGSGVTSITSVKMKNVKRTVSVTPANTTCTIGSATSASDGNGDEIIIFSGLGTAATQDYACVFPIQSWSDQDFIEITADDQTATYKLTRSTWTKGSSYTLTLNVSTGSLGTTTSITGWNEGASATIGGGGDFTIADIPAQTYNGSAKTPTPTVSYNNNTLTLDTDYTLEYAGNTNAGTAAVIAIGKGTYVGKVGVKEFTINKANNTVTLSPASLTVAYNSTASSTVSRSGDGAITATSANTGIATVIVSGTTVTATNVSEGSTTITVNVAESANYNAASTTLNVECTSLPAGALSGKFSVSASKKVYFSKGNLKYNGSTWSFFDNQWDYLTTHDGTTWDKFGLSTSSTTYGMNTSTSNGDYSGSFVDWGKVAISNGGNTANSGWFTLSSAEWTYLFNTRTPTSGVRYAKATVNGVSGVILLPDDWNTSYYSLSSTNTANAAFTANSISSSDWSSKFAAHGAVFLPAAGYRFGSSVDSAGSGGGYWSSTASGTDYAYGVSFYPSDLDPAGSYTRYSGFSVRLVRVAQ